MLTPKPYLDIELFPCAGGFAEGFRRAGVTFDIAIEWLANHCESYEQNLGHRPIQMDVVALWELCKLGWRPQQRVRLLSADPPCTPWSRAGKRLGTDDPRDMLEATCQLIAFLQPDLYLIGNVPGLDDGPNLHIVQKHIGGLAQHGYCTADYTRLDAANYGVPQHRYRPFWFGHKAGPCIQWPAPTHCDPDDCTNLTLPGVDELLPWVTCRQALGHLSGDDLGRPIKLRRRQANSAQHGSVPERPARVVGTSNLSDGNVLLGPDAPRAGKKKKNHGTPQGERITPADASSPTIMSGHGRHTIIEPLELQHGTAKKPKVDRRPPASKAQGNRVGDMDKPSPTQTAKPSRKGAGAHGVFTIQDRRGGQSGLSHADSPSSAILRNTHGNGSVLVLNAKHPAIGVDRPATTIRGGGEGHSAPNVVLMNAKHPPAQLDRPSPTVGAKDRGQTSVIQTTANHQASKHDQPAKTVRASDGEGHNRALEWPWDRPATTVLADERLGPPGHHSEDFAILNTDGDGIVISERAAAILQGFPEDWKFIGASKKQRWSQIGQAMPPPLAHAVAKSVVQQIAKTDQLHDEAGLRIMDGGG